VGGTPAQEARLVQRRRVPVADMVSVVVAHEVQRPHVDRTAEPVHLLIGRPYVLAVSVSNRLDMVRPRAAGRVCNLPSSPASSCCTAGVTRGFVQENGLPPATSSVTSTPCPSSTDTGSSSAIRSAGKSCSARNAGSPRHPRRSRPRLRDERRSALPRASRPGGSRAASPAGVRRGRPARLCGSRIVLRDALSAPRARMADGGTAALPSFIAARASVYRSPDLRARSRTARLKLPCLVTPSRPRRAPVLQ
jgi:hypothetical protein